MLRSYNLGSYWINLQSTDISKPICNNAKLINEQNAQIQLLDGLITM